MRLFSHTLARFATSATVLLGTMIAALGLSACAQLSGAFSSIPPYRMPAQLNPERIINQVTFSAYSTDFIDELMALNPGWAAYLGRYDQANRLSIPNATDRTVRDQFAHRHLAKLREFDVDALPPPLHTDHQIIQRYLESDLWQRNVLKSWQWNPASYNVAGGFAVLLAADYAAPAQQFADLSQRLQYVPAYYRAARENITTPTREHTQLAIQQNRGVASVLGTELESRVRAAALPARETETLLARIADARAAAQGYIDWLTALEPTLTEDRARSFRLGAALYEPYYTHRIGVGGSAEGLYRRALAERDRLHADMAVRAARLWPSLFPNTPVPSDRLELIAAVIDTLSDNHAAAEDFVATVRGQIPELEAFVVENQLVDLDPDKPLVVRLTPEYKRGVASASVDAPGPFNPSAETYYNVSPLDDMSPEEAESFLREYNHWVLQILNIHEAVPGHYTQLVYANKSPSLIKSILRNGAMIEGWAVYAERMMLEAGYGQPTQEAADKMWLMYGKWNLRVVCNTILDYGVHVLGMTENEGLDLLMRQAFQTQAEATKKWRRVTLSQVQLTSYYAGFDAILQLRARQKATLGDDFDLRAFHHEFLSYGSAPIPMIAELMEQ